MSKTFTATWLGDADPSSQIITEGGIRFIKGEPTKVPVDCSVNGIAWADAIRFNPTFAIGDEDDEPIDAGEDEERKALTDELDARGIKYHPHSRLDTLRTKLAE